jgi:hypothetical protein
MQADADFRTEAAGAHPITVAIGLGVVRCSTMGKTASEIGILEGIS